mgnify:CR=1 FL=1
MLMPKKVKYRKQQRGRMAGKAWRGSDVSFGDYGLKALEPCWLTARQIEAARRAMTRFVKRGGKIVAGGQRPKGDDYDKGFYYQPTLVADVDPASRMIQEEVFGPALPIVRVKNLDQAIEQANGSIFGLGSSIWTRDINRAMYGAENIEAGYTWVNSAQIIYDELPFGGVKQSGNGRDKSLHAFDKYTELKTTWIRLAV